MQTVYFSVQVLPQAQWDDIASTPCKAQVSLTCQMAGVF